MKSSKIIRKIIIINVVLLFIECALLSLLFYLNTILVPSGETASSFLTFFLQRSLLYTILVIVMSGVLKILFLRPVLHVQLDGKDIKNTSSLVKAEARLSRLTMFTFFVNAVLLSAFVPIAAVFSGTLATIPPLKMLLYAGLGFIASILFSFMQTGIDTDQLTGIYNQLDKQQIRRKQKKTFLTVSSGLNLLFFGGIVFVLLFAIINIDEYNIAESASNSNLGILLAIGGVILLLMLFSFLPYTARLRKRISKNRSFLENLLYGQDFFNQKITITRLDDVGKLEDVTNRLVHRFKEILEAVFSNTGTIQSVSGSLNSSIDNASAAIEEMVTTVHQITASTSNQMDVVKITSSKLEEMLIGIDGTSADVIDLTTFVQETSTAMHQSTASIQTISKNTEQVNKLANRLVEISNKGSISVEESIAAIREIEKASIQVSEIVVIISEIAEKTNLLSLNAAIEAAHAGDSGRGFAIVADEIRKLADQSNQNIALISQQIENMKEKVKTGVALSTFAGESFSKIHEDIKLTDAHIGQVSIALQEQNAGVSQIMSALEEMVNKTVEVKEISADLKIMSQEIHKFMEELMNISTTINDATGEQNKGNTEILSMISSVKDFAEKNLSVVVNLQAVMTIYKDKNISERQSAEIAESEALETAEGEALETISAAE